MVKDRDMEIRIVAERLSIFLGLNWMIARVQDREHSIRWQVYIVGMADRYQVQTHPGRDL